MPSRHIWIHRYVPVRLIVSAEAAVATHAAAMRPKASDNSLITKLHPWCEDEPDKADDE
jgi:hypothetical protein